MGRTPPLASSLNVAPLSPRLLSTTLRHRRRPAWRLVFPLWLLFVMGGAALGAGLLGGTVLEIDLETPQVVLQMPEGHASLYAAATADVLKGLKVGDRVSIELDEAGRIVKVVKLPVDPGN